MTQHTKHRQIATVVVLGVLIALSLACAPAMAAQGDATLQYNTSGSVESSPLVLGDKVVAISSDGNLYSVYKNGTLNWNVSVGDLSNYSPSYANGSVYIQTSTEVVAVNESDGTIQWNVSIDGVGSDASTSTGSGYVFAGSDDGRVYAINQTSGGVKWSYNTGSQIRSPITSHDGVVYAGNDGGDVVALNHDGTLKWSNSTGSQMDSGATVSDGLVYIGADSGTLHAIDNTDGSFAWNASTSNVIETTPTVYGGSVYVANNDGNLYSFNAQNGSNEWVTGVASDLIYSSPTVAGDTIYLGSWDNNMYAVNLSGGVKWSFTSTTVISSPTVDDGVVFFGTNGNSIYGVDTDHNDTSSGSRVQQAVLGSTAEYVGYDVNGGFDPSDPQLDNLYDLPTTGDDSGARLKALIGDDIIGLLILLTLGAAAVGKRINAYAALAAAQVGMVILFFAGFMPLDLTLLSVPLAGMLALNIERNVGGAFNDRVR